MTHASAPWRVAGGALAGVAIANHVVGVPPAASPWWPVAGTVIVAALAGWALGPVRRLLHTPGFVPVALLGWMAAVYGCVPETDQVVPAAAWLVAMLVVEAVYCRMLPWVAHLAGVAIVLWAGLYGAAGQGRAVVGALFGVWGLLLGPLVGVAIPRLHHARLLARWMVTGIGGAATLVVARTGALRPPVDGALRSAVVAAAASAALALIIAGLAARRAHPSLPDRSGQRPRCPGSTR